MSKWTQLRKNKRFHFQRMKKKTTVLLHFCNTTYQYQLDQEKEKKLTIYAQRLPIIINYLSIPIQRQSELAKFQNGQYRSHSCHRVYQQMQTYESFFFPRDIV